MTFLIDSDRAIDYLKGYKRAVDLIERLTADGLAISVVTYAELFEGVYFGSDPEGDAADLEGFLQGISIVPVTLAIARRFATIRGDLRRSGNLIADMDLFIAATAIEHGLTLVTANRRHFERIPGLTLHTSD